MTLLSKSHATVSRRRKTPIGTRAKRKRLFQFDSLESRTLLAYVFTYNGTTGPEVVDETGGNDSFTVVNNGYGSLEWSTDGGATFSTNWGNSIGDTLAASPAVSLTINLGGDNSAIVSGTSQVSTSSASGVQAKLTLNALTGNTDDSVTFNDTESPGGLGTYTFNGASRTVSGPLDDISATLGVNAFGGGVTIQGNNTNNTYDVESTYETSGVAEPLTVESGSGDDTVNVLSTAASTPQATATVDLGSGTYVVNVGSASTLAGIGSAVAISDPSGTTTLTLDDSEDTNNSTATLDSLSGNNNAPNEVTGLSAGAIEYGSGVTALNINGGTSDSGLVGVAFDINGTQAITTTTIDGGPNLNHFNLSNAGLTGGLDNLPGPVVVNGGSSSSDSVTLDDSSANFNDTYTIGATTVSRQRFGGLTYGGIATLTLNAENTLVANINGNNTINITTTAPGVTTNVNGQGGADKINVMSTGTSGVLNISTGGTAGSTVNVLADNEPVNIDLGGSESSDAVNIGSTGGAGTMVGILSSVGILDPNGAFALTFHDEDDATSQIWELNNNDSDGEYGSATVGFSSAIATTTYRPGDLSSPLTLDGGSGGNTFLVNNTTSFDDVATDLNTGTGNDTVDVYATGDDALNIDGQNGTDTVTLGGRADVGMQSLAGTINVTNDKGSTALVLDDSEDTIGQSVTVADNGTNGSVTEVSPPNSTNYTIDYPDLDISSLTIDGGTGGNTFTVDGTVANPSFPLTPTTLYKGDSLLNTVDVLATTADSHLLIHGEGGIGSTDDVTLGDNGSVANIKGLVSVDELNGGLTNLTVALWDDGLAHSLDLSSDGTTSTLHDDLGNLPNDITYNTASLASLTIITDGAADQTLDVDFGAGGNPIPTADSPGLIYNGNGGGGQAGTQTLDISGELTSGPFASETHNANDPSVQNQNGQYGSIFFTDANGVATSLDYSGLQPINDTATATLYTFNDDADDQSFTATNGPTVLSFGTIQFANTPVSPPSTFETTNVANKTNIVFNTPFNDLYNGIIGVVNIPAASTGLASLAFNTPTTAENSVSILSTPAGVATSLVGGSDQDVTQVSGVGVAAGTTLVVNGGAGVNALTYDAGGGNPTVTAGLLAGEVLITIPGAGTVDALNYAQITIINAFDPPPVIGTPVTIDSLEGVQLVGALAGTFTWPLAGSLPTVLPAGLPADNFTATIDWGDGTTTTAGTITQDSTAASIYDVTGDHIYADPGTYSVSMTVTLIPGSITVLVNGTTVTEGGPASTVSGPSGTANVGNAAITVSADPIVGVEGGTIASAPIASFIDAGGESGSPDPTGDFAATISILNGAGATVLSVPAVSITINQNSTSNSYSVIAPALDLAAFDDGTYSVLVTVTKTVNSTVVTASGGATLVVADAPLTAGAPVVLTPTTGLSLNAVVAGTFIDGDNSAPASDFTAVIDWGDGSSTSLGTVVSTGGGGFAVEGTHAFAKPGSYDTLINVTDAGGSAVTLTGSAAVTDPAVTGVVSPISAVEGQDTGTIVLATFIDPNPLATIANVSATIGAGGWGDTTPTSSVPLAVSEIGATSSGILFQVTGSHTYGNSGSYTVAINVTTTGGVITPLTPGTATVVDANLTSSNGTTITGTEGNSTGTVLIGTFQDANQYTTVADYVAPSAGSVVVNWGDGSAPQTLTAANLVPVGSPDGVVFSIKAAHTFAEEGEYPVTITVTADGGAVTVISSYAAIADAALVDPDQPIISTTAAAYYPIPEYAPPIFNGLVATYTDSNPTSPLSDFTATIDWGDGTSPTAGTVTQPGGIGTAFDVLGSHTYASAGTTGTYPVQVFVVDSAGATMTLTNTANVAAVPIVLTGILNPASDTGSSNSDDITGNSQPNFYGTSQAYSHVTLYETPAGGTTAVLIGQVQAGGDGSWSITSSAIPAGAHTISARATDQFGLNPTGPVVITQTLVVDPIAPVITDLSFDRFDGTLTVTFADNLSGMDIQSVTNSAFYHMSAHPLAKNVHVPRMMAPRASSTLPAHYPTIRSRSTWCSTTAM